MFLFMIIAGFPLSFRDIIWPLVIGLGLLIATAGCIVINVKASGSRSVRVLYGALGCILLGAIVVAMLLIYVMTSGRVFFFAW